MSDRVVLHGSMVAGKFVPDAHQSAVWAAMGSRFHGRVQVTIEVERKVRTDAQNRRYWSLLVPVAQEILSQGRLVPLSKDQTHEVLKLAFIGQEETELGPVPISSRGLDTRQFSVFSDKVDAWLAEKGCVLKDLDERWWPENEETVERKETP